MRQDLGNYLIKTLGNYVTVDSLSFSYFRRASRTSTPFTSFLLVGARGKIWGMHSELMLETDSEERRITIPGRRYGFQGHDGYPEMYDIFARMVLDGEEPYSTASVGLENMLTAYASQLALIEKRVVRRAELEGLVTVPASPAGQGG